jgi:hypothetical protein
MQIEQASRTEKDFWQLAGMYDKLDAKRERRERYWVTLSTDNFSEWELWNDETIIPRPLNHEWWRELLSGDFIDVIFDCPHELHELVSSPAIYDQLVGLDENRKEILYYWAVRQWSPQKIAAFRGQTDRNIRKVYGVTIRNVRKRLYERLRARYERSAPLTLEQREFCANYKAGIFNDTKGGGNDEAE